MGSFAYGLGPDVADGSLNNIETVLSTYFEGMDVPPSGVQPARWAVQHPMHSGNIAAGGFWLWEWQWKYMLKTADSYLRTNIWTVSSLLVPARLATVKTLKDWATYQRYNAYMDLPTFRDQTEMYLIDYRISFRGIGESS